MPSPNMMLSKETAQRGFPLFSEESAPDDRRFSLQIGRSKVMLKEQLILKMTEFNHGDPKRIQHFTKVYEYAHTIGTLEADFLVNAYEDDLSKESICTFREKVFRTKTGMQLLNAMYGLDGIGEK